MVKINHVCKLRNKHFIDLIELFKIVERFRLNLHFKIIPTIVATTTRSSSDKLKLTINSIASHSHHPIIHTFAHVSVCFSLPSENINCLSTSSGYMNLSFVSSHKNIVEKISHFRLNYIHLNPMSSNFINKREKNRQFQ